MKIVHSILRYYPAMGGVEAYLKQLLEGLVKRGHNVKVFTSNLEYERQGCIGDLRNSINGVEVKRYNPVNIKPKGYVVIPSLIRALYKEKADIIHGHSYMHFPADIAMLISRLKRLPFVFNPFLVDVGVNSLWRGIYKSTMGNLLMEADTVIVISPFEEKIIKENGFPAKRIEYIPPGIDMEEFDRVTHNVYERYNLKDNIVLFTGRLDYYKGIDILLRAIPAVLKEVPQTTFFFSGPDWGYQIYLTSLVKQLNIEDKVIFAGVLSRDDLISAYKNATVFAFPSRYELFGIVLLEAMAAGLAIVASDSSAIPFIIQDSENGLLFKTNDHHSLAQQITKLLKDARLRSDISARAKDLVRKNYSLTESVEKLEAVYLSLLN